MNERLKSLRKQHVHGEKSMVAIELEHLVL